ncbi:hypothetical protein GMA5_11 [Gordonia phage GMA5]|uniref:Uncharacterized protein n=1 Tax=Gordonia phage GMA5 TaxID=1647472 RepID=A0A0K0MX60_9CAUD|nr:hypothetical protein BH786_gp11 [Gordonia phage GMA5]AKI28623.1 hypothetical protein GMA5_11 [Gordonia phage GMA5]
MAIQRILLDVLMNDGTEHTDVVITVKDRKVAADVGRRHKWGTAQDDPETYSMFWAYSALHRTGRFQGSFDEFIDAAEVITAAEVGEVDPTATTTPVV